MKGNLYLREDVYFEPLLNHWFAWPYLIPPVTGARHIVNTQKRIMTSFINNYKLHIMAVNEPGMAGAEFLDCSEDQLEDIKRLITEIDEQHEDLVELSTAVKELDDMLRAHTSGETIEQLYEKIPTRLRGYVELFMDMNHNPSYRLLEALLYAGPLYKTSLQSVSFGMLSLVEERPFVLSTPRLPDDHHLQMPIDYNHSILDKIFAAREYPISEEQLSEIFANQELAGGLDYRKLFTNDAPPKVHQPVKEGVRMCYLGHAGFLIETKDVTILVDPVIASRGEDNADEIISFSELPPRIDYICLTHNHQDHVNFETLLQLRYKTDTILVPKNNGGSLADPSMRLMLKQFGFNVQEMDDLDERTVSGGRIVSLPFLGEHGDLNIRSKTAWLYELEGRKFFVGADSSNLDPEMYRHLQRVIGGVDVLAIGMECIGAPYTWLYGALNTKRVSRNVKESRRLNGANHDQAMHMIETFGPDQVFIYALGMEKWYKYFMGIDYDDDSVQVVESTKTVKHCEDMQIAAERLYAKHVIELH